MSDVVEIKTAADEGPASPSKMRTSAEKNPADEPPKPARKKPADKNQKPTRGYLGWSDAPIVEWKVEKEYEGRKNWKERWGPGNPWWKRYNKWVCSDITRMPMRKPSLRSLEWLVYQREHELAPAGECRTRKRRGIKDYFLEPLDTYACCPGPWPITTAGEIGYLAKHPGCLLEIYGNDFMKKPPLPANQPKISSFLANSQ